jgi:uncharacterized protein YyaL (SSP411 family)
MREPNRHCGGKLLFFALFSSAIFLTACTFENTDMNLNRYNLLSRESSPYLLQHAENPVHWKPWGEVAFQEAREKDRLMIVSIGYSSCHWCHVMAHECFEDSATAEIMNRHFVSVKVDREERPDVDQIYMTALQLMSGQGGWPLNVVCLPDGRPVWGATYVPKEKWQQALNQLAEMYETDSVKMEEYAERLKEGITQAELVEVKDINLDFSKDDARKMVNTWSSRFDTTEGGPHRAPKFPMPVNYMFLLEMGILDQNSRALKQVELTLNKMAHGGIYDQVGGGFARYSTDKEWIVPHFEKMLYDNAQLLSLYSRAYRYFGHQEYRRVLLETLEWIEREMIGEQNSYFSAIDADSEGQEGKFYVWSEEELRSIIKPGDWQEFTKYFDLKKGAWEGNIILTTSGENISEKKLKGWKEKLLRARASRQAPGIDDKSLTSWNALLICGFIDAAKAFQKDDPDLAEELLRRAELTGQWISINQSGSYFNQLYHSSRYGKGSVEGLLEDYAFTIQAFLDLFEYTGESNYLKRVLNWVDVLDQNFMDHESGLYYTRSLNGEQLISKSLDRVDNVIPSPNSVMAHNLWRLGILEHDEYRTRQAIKMLSQIDRERLLNYGDSYANWGRLLLRISFPSPEVVITGKQSQSYYLKLQHSYYPNTSWIWSSHDDDLPVLRNRQVEGETMVYICENRVCQLPVNTLDEARKQLQAAF